MKSAITVGAGMIALSVDEARGGEVGAVRTKAVAIGAILVAGVAVVWGAGSVLARWTRDSFTTTYCRGIDPRRGVTLDGRAVGTDDYGCVDVVHFPFMRRVLRYFDEAGIEHRDVIP